MAADFTGSYVPSQISDIVGLTEALAVAGTPGTSGYSGHDGCPGTYTVTLLFSLSIDNNPSGTFTLTRQTNGTWRHFNAGSPNGDTEVLISNDGSDWRLDHNDAAGNQIAFLQAYVAGTCPPLSGWGTGVGGGSVAATITAMTNSYSGASGYSGTNGTNGTNGTSGTSGVSGTSGRSGYSGSTGTSGTSGTSGFSGTSGRSGYSGITPTGTAGNVAGFNAGGVLSDSGQSLNGLVLAISDVTGSLSEHEANTSNPHSTTIDQVGGRVHPGFRSGRIYVPPTSPNNGYANMTSNSVNNLCAYPIYIASAVTLDGLVCKQISAGTTGDLNYMGVWSNANGLPSAQLAGGTVSAVAAGIKTVSIAITLTPGIYWLCIIPGVAGQYMGGSASAGGTYALGLWYTGCTSDVEQGQCLVKHSGTITPGSAPTTWTGTTYVSNNVNVPAVGMRIA